MFCFAIPNFTSAAVVDLLEGKTGIMEKTGKEYKNMTDGNPHTFDELLSPNFVVFDLGDVYVIDKYTINETVGNGNGDPGTGTNVIYYDSYRRVLKNTPNKYEMAEKVDGVRYVGLKYNYLNRKKIYEFKVYGTTDKVTNVENLKAEVGLNEVALSWDNPDTPKFTGVNIYRDKQQIVKLDKTKNSYVVKGLKEAEEYSFTVKSVDENGFETSGATKKVIMKMPVIAPPENVFLTPQDKKLVIAWDNVKSPFLKGYNVYVDGKKINDNPLTSSKLIVKNLENDKSYKVQVSAVNKNDVEGDKSKEHTEKPSSDALEVEYDVKMPFGLKDVIDVAMMLLLIVAPLTLLGLAFIYYKPIVTFLYNSIQKKK